MFLRGCKQSLQKLLTSLRTLHRCQFVTRYRPSNLTWCTSQLGKLRTRLYGVSDTLQFLHSGSWNAVPALHVPGRRDGRVGVRWLCTGWYFWISTFSLFIGLPTDWTAIGRWEEEEEQIFKIKIIENRVTSCSLFVGTQPGGDSPCKVHC